MHRVGSVIAPVLLIVCTVVQLGVIWMGSPEPLTDAQLELVWTPKSYAAETAELAALPWWKNYRVLAGALTAASAILVWVWR